MALQKHLKARTDRPKTLDASAARGAGDGTVKVKVKGITSGEVFLKNDAKTVYRLTWSKKTKPARHLPAGAYTVTGYRLVDGEWFLSTTGGKATIQVRAGKTTRLELDPTIHVKLRAQRKKNGSVFLGMNIRNDRGMGVSIYRKGKRISIPYRFRAKTGDEVSSGTMNYG